MPPRPGLQCLCSAASQRTFTTSATTHASAASKARWRHDPYAAAQAAAKKAANRSRQEIIKQERKEALGDPVRGITTPFVESFDTAEPKPFPSKYNVPPEKGEHLNFFLDKEELAGAIEKTKSLVSPPIIDDPAWSPAEERQQARDDEFANADEAMKRIAQMRLGSAKDRQRINNARILQVFGRHNTDQFLPPRQGGAPPASDSLMAPMPRAGADTGSSEVQIAILTAKIRSLANELERSGRNDKVGKRDLRLLVHRRQKLLKYMRRKERGGPRWQHLIETLGLTEGTWKGEISL